MVRPGEEEETEPELPQEAFDADGPINKDAPKPAPLEFNIPNLFKLDSDRTIHLNCMARKQRNTPIICPNRKTALSIFASLKDTIMDKDCNKLQFESFPDKLDDLNEDERKFKESSINKICQKLEYGDTGNPELSNPTSLMSIKHRNGYFIERHPVAIENLKVKLQKKIVQKRKKEPTPEPVEEEPIKIARNDPVDEQSGRQYNQYMFDILNKVMTGDITTDDYFTHYNF